MSATRSMASIPYCGQKQEARFKLCAAVKSQRPFAGFDNPAKGLWIHVSNPLSGLDFYWSWICTCSKSMRIPKTFNPQLYDLFKEHFRPAAELDELDLCVNLKIVSFDPVTSPIDHSKGEISLKNNLKHS